MTPVGAMPEYLADDGPDRVQRVIRTAHLALDFSWNVDRWGHTVSILAAGRWRPIASATGAVSIAGDLVLPVYQDFHYQEGGGCGVALLLGQSGAHLFSASFGVEEGPEGAFVRVDVADRVRGNAPDFGCVYDVREPPTDAIEGKRSQIVWDVPDGGRMTLCGDGPPEIPVLVALSGPRADGQSDPDQVWITERPRRAKRASRCRYEWRFVAAGDGGLQTT